MTTNAVTQHEIRVTIEQAIQEFQGYILSYLVVENNDIRMVLVLSQPGAFLNDRVTVAAQIAAFLEKHYGFTQCSANDHTLTFADILWYPHQIRFVTIEKWKELIQMESMSIPSTPLQGPTSDEVQAFLGYLAKDFPTERTFSDHDLGIMAITSMVYNPEELKELVLIALLEHLLQRRVASSPLQTVGSVVLRGLDSFGVGFSVPFKDISEK